MNQRPPTPLHDGNWQTIDGKLVDADLLPASQPSKPDKAAAKPVNNTHPQPAPDTDDAPQRGRTHTSKRSKPE